MSTVTIRKFVICSTVIFLCLVLNALIHQSVFNISLFCNSSDQRKTQKNPIIDTFGEVSVPLESEIRHMTQKPVQNEEDGGFLGEEKNDGNPSSTLRTVYQPDSKGFMEKKIEKDFSNFDEKNSEHSERSAKFSRNQQRQRDPIVTNAIPPFCWSGGWLSENEEESEVMISLPSSEHRKDRMVTVHSADDGRIEEAAEKVGAEKRFELTTVPPPGAGQALPEGFHVAPRVSVSGTPTPIAARSDAKKLEEEVRPTETASRQETGGPTEAENRAVDSQIVSGTGEMALSELPGTKKMKPFPEVTEEERPLEVSEESEFRDPELSQNLAEIQHRTPDAAEETGAAAETGNFPLAPGEPFEAPVAGYFGVRKPIVLPDVPTAAEGNGDVLVIEDVSEPESPTPELKDFPQVTE